MFPLLFSSGFQDIMDYDEVVYERLQELSIGQISSLSLLYLNQVFRLHKKKREADWEEPAVATTAAFDSEASATTSAVAALSASSNHIKKRCGGGGSNNSTRQS